VLPVTVAVVIPTFNRPDLLAACLSALEEHTPEHVRVVVDNGFVGSPIFRTGPKAWCTAGRNLGFAAGCNRGAEMATGADVYVFLNDDTVPQPRWLDPLVAAIDAGALIAGPHLVYPDGRTQHAGVTVAVEAGTLVARNRTVPHPSGPVAAVTGACLAVAGPWFRRHSGFDEGFWNGYEDVDLCLRAGDRVAYVAESMLVHHESQSGPERWAGVAENVRRLQGKWGDQWPTTTRTPES